MTCSHSVHRVYVLCVPKVSLQSAKRVHVSCPGASGDAAAAAGLTGSLASAGLRGLSALVESQDSFTQT